MCKLQNVLSHQSIRSQRSRTRTRSALERIIAHGLPAVNEIPFLRATGTLPRGTIMGMDMRRAIGNGVRQFHMTLQPLMQIPGLRNVDRRPITVG